MAKRLFVVHTQYNLILATGMATSADDLILFRDFALTDELKTKLGKCFDRCLYIEGNYPKKQLSTKEKDRKIQINCQSIKMFMNFAYDEILVVDDMCIQEMYVLKCAFNLNKQVVMSWLEDGSNAYFSNEVISTGMGGTPLKRFIRKLYFSVKYGLGKFYDLGICMGAHKCLSKIYVTFPGYVRAELQSKEQIEITQEQFKKGLAIMYTGEPVHMEENCVVIAVDKLDVYGNKLSIVNAQIKQIVELAISEGKKVYCKYHPRETQRMEALRETEELNCKIAMEYYLTNTTAKCMTVVGVMSTALQTAKKLGYEVISLAFSVGTNENVIDFYRSIDIKIR